MIDRTHSKAAFAWREKSMGTIQRCTYAITNSRPERTAGVVLAAVSVTFSDFYYTDSPTGFQMIQGSNIAFISSLVRVSGVYLSQRRAHWITVRLKA